MGQVLNKVWVNTDDSDDEDDCCDDQHPGDVTNVVDMLEKLKIESPTKLICEDESLLSLESLRRRKSSLISCDFDLLANIEPPEELLKIDEMSDYEQLDDEVDERRKRLVNCDRLEEKRNSSDKSSFSNHQQELEDLFLHDFTFLDDVQFPIDNEILDKMEESFQRCLAERLKKSNLKQN